MNRLKRMWEAGCVWMPLRWDTRPRGLSAGSLGMGPDLSSHCRLPAHDQHERSHHGTIRGLLGSPARPLLRHPVEAACTLATGSSLQLTSPACGHLPWHGRRLRPPEADHILHQLY